MIVQCDQCQKKYRLDKNKIPAKGKSVRCTSCKHVFKVSVPKEESSISEPQNISKKQPNSKTEVPESKKPSKQKVVNLPPYAQWDDDIIMVTLPGDTLDVANCNEFKEAIHSILETSNRVVFNMENIKFVDSSGCGTLNACIKRIKKHGGDIKICNVLDQVGAIFRLIKLNRVFHICDTREDAIHAYSLSD